MNKGFTLIEMLVVLSIIGILVTISTFGLQGAREAARDKRRLTDIESIRSGLELYRSDCNIYPSGPLPTGQLIGSGTPSRCALTNVYIQDVPEDPQDPARGYEYVQLSATTYAICASLENAPATPPLGLSNCPANCGSEACNFAVLNP